ncbi:MAG TPA: hypothetical protein GXZ45_07065 [Propionibacterium sp.]|nr:hypothetical protein [Propionibacterium sp.]
MRIPTARWRVDEAPLSCGHTMSVRQGEASTYCSWCAASVAVLPAAA